MSTPTVGLESPPRKSKAWGLSLFFRLDGKKLSLRQERLAWASAAFVMLIAGWQLSDVEAETASGHGSVAVNSPNLAERFRILPVRDDPSTDAPHQQRQVATEARVLTPPEVIPRPRDLGKIPPGTLVKAILVTGASNGPVKAKLSETLNVDGETLLDEGAVLLGTGTSTEERLQVTFSQIIFRDGTFAPFQAHACDVGDRIVGLKGSKVGDKALNIAGSIGLGFVGGMSEGLQDYQGQHGVAVRPPTVRNALLHATATTALEQSRNLMSDLKSRQPIIEVSPGTEILVFVGGG